MPPKATKAAASKAASDAKKPAATKASAKTTSKAAATTKATTSKAAAAKAVKKDEKPAKASAKSGSQTDDKPVTNGAPSNKRKASETESENEQDVVMEEPQPKKTKTEKAPPRAAPAKAKKAVHVEIGKKINEAPTQVLDIYVFGEGTSGELGLGSKRVNGKKPIDVKRPRLNDNLSAKTVGVVQIACGGMHVAALTRDNKILTWGVNDQGALGRDTTWDGGLRDADNADDSDSEDEDDTGINPRESTPTALSEEDFAPGTKFVQVVASDSASFVLTEDGRVYGWGTFRSSDGILGFTETVKVQTRPVLLAGLKNIKALASGANHILALDHKGNVVAWGCGQQNQLGRRIIERNKMSSLIPQGVGLPRGKIAKIACGSYHSFAIDNKGAVWGWGLNNFGEIGVENSAGEDDAVILKPVKINFLADHTVTGIKGGIHHSLACTDKGELFAWGRVDGYQVGFELEAIEKVDEDTKASISDVVAVAAGTDNSFAISKDGKAYSWGFSSNYQTGQGTIDDVHVPTLIDNTATRDKKIIAAGAGGQFSVLIGIAEDVPATNGEVNGVH
ncbi:regulator of chromosome condensation beta-lactamase-inhibitor ii [Trichoderma arundinaceum]|uniref:Regulator of chromosome condensation beta-lactamase-inhibitor ii n=1 Tax=Trichoderma arundinaceum TaxID=490622 RepID=A0A395NQF5_TRIAR|nr:regulator of chromosome condensation beta-lactamase-inhibitor ii [Trichoderma arundinaceum]